MTSSAITESVPDLAETFASLRLYGDDLCPEEITRLLKLEPVDSASKGLLTTTASGNSRQAPTGRWIFSSEGKVLSPNLEIHIAWILDQLESNGVGISSLPGVETADISCYWGSANGHGGLEFSPNILGRLAKSGLTLGLDIYFT